MHRGWSAGISRVRMLGLLAGMLISDTTVRDAVDSYDSQDMDTSKEMMGNCYDSDTNKTISPELTLAWATEHRQNFIVGGGNDPSLGLKRIHRTILPRVLQTLLRSARPCVLIDVGAASYGVKEGYDYSDSLIFLSLFQARCSVHAFDLGESNLQELQRSSGHHSSLHTHRLALSDNAGQSSIRTPGGLSMGNLWSIAPDPSLHGRAGLIPTTTLDIFAEQNNIPHVAYLKVDVQGSEPQVAKGMTNLLTQRRLALGSFEYSQHWGAQESLQKFQSWLREHGYATYLVAADPKRRGTFLVPVSGRFWRRDLEMCEPGSQRRCVIDALVVKSPSQFERKLLHLVNNWRCGGMRRHALSVQPGT